MTRQLNPPPASFESWHMPGQSARQFEFDHGKSRGQSYGAYRAVNRNGKEQQAPILRSLPAERPEPVQTPTKKKVSPRTSQRQKQGVGSGELEPHGQTQTQTYLAQPADQTTPLAFANSPTPSPPSFTSPAPPLDSLRTRTTPSSSPVDSMAIHQPSPNITTPPIDQNWPTYEPNILAATQHQRLINNQRAMQSQPLLRNEEWRQYSEVSILIGGFNSSLSPHVSIRDIYRTLYQYGTIEMIQFLVDPSGHKTGRARVRFSKVIVPFWESGNIDFGAGPTRTILQKPQGLEVIQSRVNPSRTFPVKMAFDVKSLKFGFMLQQEEFMAMYSNTPGSEIRWEVNFKRKKVEITFKLCFKKGETENVSVVSEPVSEVNTSFDRTETYMIEIPFSHLQELFVPADEDQNDSLRTFVIPLPGPPKYYRQLKDWSKSMGDSGLTHWTIYDVWMRQTDIEYNMKDRQSQPVSLKHRQPVIDIGRWTTYRLSFDLGDTKKMEDFNKMIDGLQDFNIRAKALQAFRVNYNKSQLCPIYNYLDQEIKMAASNSVHLLQKPFLSFPVRYQLEVCISHGYLNEHNITPDFIHRLEGMPERSAQILLECVQERKKRFFNPMDVFTIPRDRRADSSKSISDTCVYMRRATVTPTGILFQTPSVEISNRVIRSYSRYADRFLRVSFTDEKQIGRIRFTDKFTSNELFTRVYRTLEHGIVIGDRRYEFLAFGNSQLREHGTYFFAPTGKMTTAKIRNWMGDFKSIKTVAKHASRLGQCFSTTKAFKSCKVDCKKILDIERNSFNFTDGVGKMSPVVARLLTEEMLKPQRRPSADYQSSCFQFRLAGCKGVLALDPNVPNLEIHIRDSQEKFWSSHDKLEIIRYSQFASASLNRQLIQVMSSLGVPDEFFKKRLRALLRDYTEAESNPNKALELLMKHIDPNHMTLSIANLVRGGFMDCQEPFVMSLIRLWRSWTVKSLKEKAKIILDDGAFVLGVVDETATLRGYYEDAPEDELPQIFCQISPPLSKKRKIITGRCVVTRNPSLHPGDVRIVEAVDRPELHHLVDVVVFPQTGTRDVPSMLSGGDLDGDDYVVIWDEELIAPGVLINEPPASYIGNKAEGLDRDVNIGDITKFFVDYMKNDRLGAIANAHLAWADRFPEGVKSNTCIELAQLHSDAVDYPKTGIKAQMQKRHRVRQWPHFFDKPIEEGQYRSEKILGQLYDLVERIDFKPCYDSQPDEQLITAFELTENELQEAKEVKVEYDAAMKRIMAQHDIKTEFEVWSTFVMSHSNANDYKFHEEIGEISSSLKERFRKIVTNSCNDRRSQLPRKVAAMYATTAREIEDAKRKQQADRVRMTPRNRNDPPSEQLSKEDIEGLPFMSFPWIFPEILVDISHGRLVAPRDYVPVHDDVSLVLETDFEEVSIESLTGDSDIAVSDGDGHGNSEDGSDVEVVEAI